MRIFKNHSRLIFFQFFRTSWLISWRKEIYIICTRLLSTWHVLAMKSQVVASAIRLELITDICGFLLLDNSDWTIWFLRSNYLVLLQTAFVSYFMDLTLECKFICRGCRLSFHFVLFLWNKLGHYLWREEMFIFFVFAMARLSLYLIVLSFSFL